MDKIAKDRDRWVVEDHFRLRGLEMTRIETFTDAAFAFALTLLVVSLDMPETYGQLKQALLGVPAFAANFVLLMLFWWGHHRFSRRFGLEDGTTITLSCALVFTVLVYVYPLKFVFGTFASWLNYLMTGEPMGALRMEPSELNGLFMIYAIGFIAMSGALVLLNWHALHLAEQLELNEIEIFDTRGEIAVWLALGGSGLLSILVALLFGQNPPGLPGFAYMINAFLLPWLGIRHARLRAERFGA